MVTGPIPVAQIVMGAPSFAGFPGELSNSLVKEPLAISYSLSRRP
jgi:hypothetical protein